MTTRTCSCQPHLLCLGPIGYDPECPEHGDPTLELALSDAEVFALATRRARLTLDDAWSPRPYVA